MDTLRIRWFRFLPLFALPGLILAGPPSFTAGLQWESRYVTEGRDNLGNGGLFTFSGATEWEHLSLDIWYASGDRSSYRELNLTARYTIEVGLMEAAAGLTRLEFPVDGGQDNELFAGLALPAFAGIIPAIDYVYSTEADGGFLEFTLSTSLSFLDERLTLEPYVLQSLDFGYASPQHDGLNHFQAGLVLQALLTPETRLLASAAHSWGQEDVTREGLGNVSWVTLGIERVF